MELKKPDWHCYPKLDVPEGTGPDVRLHKRDLHRDRHHREGWQKSYADSNGRRRSHIAWTRNAHDRVQIRAVVIN